MIAIRPVWHRGTQRAKRLLVRLRNRDFRSRRVGHPLALRENITKAATSTNERLLEIGPFFRPVVAGPKVQYFDVLDQEELKARAIQHGYDPAQVPAIDHVSPTGDLSCVTETYDAVISAHCIEHQPDLIKHLLDVARILRPGGRYFILIPDKRYCFDHFIPESELPAIRAAHAERRTVHRVESVIEHRAFTTHNDCVRHWSGDHADPGFWQSILPRLHAAMEEFREADGRYIDVHAWQFTPSSFRRIIETLRKDDGVPFAIENVFDTPIDRNEFSVVLRAIGSAEE